jgi:ABC-type branched-subunit amino acid transport system ATPase component
MKAAPDKKALLEIRNLTKRFGGLTVIDDLSIVVPGGQRTAVIGPNGAGKTMLFNLITGIYPPTAGEIRLAGHDLTVLPSVERIRHGVARTFQNVRLMGHLSVVENVLIGQHHRASRWFDLLKPILASRRSQSMEEAREGLREARLEAYAEILVRNLPFGVRKQIELVRAMMAQPKLLLLDEPAAGLNPAETNAFKDQLEKIAANGVTLLVIEHNMQFVGDFCETVIAINFGRKIGEGTPNEVRALPEVQEAYLGLAKSSRRRGHA